MWLRPAQVALRYRVAGVSNEKHTFSHKTGGCESTTMCVCSDINQSREHEKQFRPDPNKIAHDKHLSFTHR